MANSLDGGRRASVDLSFHNGNFRTVDRDGDGGDQHGAEDDTLRKYVDPEDRHADAHDGDDQGPGQRAPGTADAPRYRGSADDDRGDRRQQEFGRQGRRPAREPVGEDDASERTEAGGENKSELFCFPTFTPEAWAASSPAPIAALYRPKRVCACRRCATARTMSPTISTFGQPNDWPVIQD